LFCYAGFGKEEPLVSFIVLNDEQAKVVAKALEPIEVRDGKGNVLGSISPVWTEEDLAAVRRWMKKNPYKGRGNKRKK